MDKYTEDKYRGFMRILTDKVGLAQGEDIMLIDDLKALAASGLATTAGNFRAWQFGGRFYKSAAWGGYGLALSEEAGRRHMMYALTLMRDVGYTEAWINTKSPFSGNLHGEGHIICAPEVKVLKYGDSVPLWHLPMAIDVSCGNGLKGAHQRQGSIYHWPSGHFVLGKEITECRTKPQP